MTNWYAIETETEHRRREWQRVAADEERANQAACERGNPLRALLAQLRRPSLHGLHVPPLRLSAPFTAGSRQIADC